MKKLLALVLALVMSMSLVTISNADFNDAAEIDYTEAVEVMNAVGVLKGYDNGDFGAKDTLTRAQAAKIIAYLDLGEKVAEALPAVQVYADVPASHWAAKYIAYCADAGYVSGVGDNKFAPDEKVTGYQFGKMLLCVLGYDAKIEQMTGANWSIKVATLMEKNDINDGVDSYASLALTRDEAAQYAFNTLKATCVEYDEMGTDINLGELGNITVGASKAEKVQSGSESYKAYVGDEDTIELGEKLYKKDLKKSTVADGDDFGRPAHKWEYDNEKVGVYADTADYVIYLTDAYNASSFDNTKLQAELRDLTDNDDLVIKTNPTDYTKLYVNGAATSIDSVTNFQGVVLELFCDSENEDVVNSISALDYKLGEITDVSTKLTKAQKEDGATCKIQIDDGNYYTNDKVEGFDAKTYVEDAYILYIADGSKEILASMVAETVEGKVTAIKGEKAAIDGTYYKMTESVKSSVAYGDEGTFYLNAAGMIAKVDTNTTKSDNYAYIYSINTENKRNSEGIQTDVVTVYFVKADGTKGSAEVAIDVAVTGGGESATKKYYYEDTTTEVAIGVVAYSIDSDGKFVKETEKDTIKWQGDSVSFDKDKAKVGDVYADDETVYIFSDFSDSSKVTVKTATGYKNAKAVSGTIVWTVADDGTALYVFVKAANVSQKSDATVAVLLDTTPVKTENDDKNAVWTYDVAIDGEETTISFETSKSATSTALTGKAKGFVFEFKMDGDYVDKDSVSSTDVTSGTVSKVTSSYVTIGDKQYDLPETVYTITFEYEDLTEAEAASFDASNADIAAKLDTVTVSEGGALKDAKVVYTLDSDDNFEVVFVLEYVY